MDNDLLPLFPLEVVLLPEEALPLHIFEERYKTMIGECLEAKAAGKGEFGVVLAKGQELSSTGCTARITNVLRQYEDGRMDILTVGRRRFEVLLTNDEQPYLRAAVDFFEDDTPEAPSEAVEATAQLFRDAMTKLHRPGEQEFHLPRPYGQVSFRLAALLPLDLDFKQRLLALRSEPERLALVHRALEVFLQQLARTQECQTKAGGNGHARH